MPIPDKSCNKINSNLSAINKQQINTTIKWVKRAVLLSKKTLTKIGTNAKGKANTKSPYLEKINVDEFRDGFNVVLEKLSKYNDSIDTWYDDKYNSDKNKFYASIEEDEKKLFSFEKLDFISIGCAD